jgi:hypothetical protein
VNAVATMSVGLAGLTAMFGSLSWALSPLSAFGIMLTTRITASHPRLCSRSMPWTGA